jgi:hypothetical protein
MKINKKKEFTAPPIVRPTPNPTASFNLHAKIDELFPEIIKIKKKQPTKPEDPEEIKNPKNSTMNYLENAKNPIIQITNQDAAHKTANPTEFEIKVNDFNYLEVNFQMSKMISRWDNYTKTYKMIYGDDAYDNMYLFPNYNYEYFDMLDDKYEYEQEEILTAEKNDSYNDLSDYYIFDKYDL